MAVSRGSGTEIVRTHAFEDVSGTAQALILGVRYHIYTVLSIVIRCGALDAITDKFHITLKGFDAHAGASGQNIELVTGNPQVGETYIWNDRFSFCGAEPTGFTGSMTTVAEQDAIADQGTATAQDLMFEAESDADYNIVITFIDQNNA